MGSKGFTQIIIIGVLGLLIILVIFILYQKGTKTPIIPAIPDQLTSSIGQIGAEITVKGKVIDKDSGPLAIDGAAVMSVENENGQKINIEFPAEAFNLCSAKGGLEQFFKAKIGDKVEAFGKINNKYSISICESSSHYLKTTNQGQTVDWQLPIDLAQCKAGERRIGVHGLGSNELTVIEQGKGTCFLEYSKEIESGYTVYECSVPVSEGSIMPSGLDLLKFCKLYWSSR